MPGPLQQGQKLFNCHSRMTDEGANGAYGQFFVLGNRKIDAHSGFHHHEMASHLPERFPSGLLKCLHCFLAGYVCEPSYTSRETKALTFSVALLVLFLPAWNS